MKFFTAVALLGAASANADKKCDTSLAIWKGDSFAQTTIAVTKFADTDCKAGCDEKSDSEKNYYCCNYAGVIAKAGDAPSAATCILYTVKKDGNDNKYENALIDEKSTDTALFAAWANDGSDGDSAIKVGATLFTAAVAALYM